MKPIRFIVTKSGKAGRKSYLEKLRGRNIFVSDIGKALKMSKFVAEDFVESFNKLPANVVMEVTAKVEVA